MESSPSTWSFSMELLSHVHTLRVFLLPSSSQVRPAHDFTSLDVALLSAPPALSCSWKVGHEAAPHSLRLLLPLLLFDYSSLPRVSALVDCIQVTLHLLPLPPLDLHSFTSLPPANGAAFPLIDSKLTSCDNDNSLYQNGTQQGLSFKASTEDAVCCSNSTSQSPQHDRSQRTIPPARLGIGPDVGCKVDNSKQALQVAVSLENDNTHEYRGDNNNATEVTDDDNVEQRSQFDGDQHAFGHMAGSPLKSCAASDSSDRIEMVRGGLSEVWPNVIHSLGNDCALDHLREEPSLCFQRTEGASLTHCHPLQCSTGTFEVSKSLFSCQHKEVANKLHGDGFGSGISPEGQQGYDDCAVPGSATFVCKHCLAKVSRKPVRNVMKLPCFDWREVAENWFGNCCCSFGSAAEVLSATFEKSIQLQPGKCLVGPSTFYMEFSDLIVREDLDSSTIQRTARQWSTSYFLAFGNGFMVRENQVSKLIKWIPVRCTNCASLIGAYPYTTTDSASSKEGLHLFRCRVKTSQEEGVLNDACSFKTFLALLVEELRMTSDENTTYRFLIRSLSSNQPLLQIVVLNYDSLICTGRVSVDIKENNHCRGEIIGLDTEAKLQQSVKVLFLDCTCFTGGDLRSAELWVEGHDAETVYMLEEFVDRLREELLTHSRFCPADCVLFQNFTSSFLYTKPE